MDGNDNPYGLKWKSDERFQQGETTPFFSPKIQVDVKEKNLLSIFGDMDLQGIPRIGESPSVTAVHVHEGGNMEGFHHVEGAPFLTRMLCGHIHPVGVPLLPRGVAHLCAYPLQVAFFIVAIEVGNGIEAVAGIAQEGQERSEERRVGKEC